MCKKDYKTLLNNYRPITLFPSISKVFEKIVYNQIFEYLTINELFYKSQFMKSHSTETATLELTHFFKT